MIRKATMDDIPKISNLLDQLGYGNTSAFLEEKLNRLLVDDDEVILVHESEGKINGLLSMHVVVELALPGNTALIKYLVIDEQKRNSGIGKQLENHCCEIAKNKGCVRIQLHCAARRTDAHRFYESLGYVESPKYFSKKIV